MYLDKEKLRSLLKKAEELKFGTPINFNSNATAPPEKTVGLIVSGLSGWLKKNVTLNNGVGYGKS